jgi:hypothetical protein
MVRAGKFTLKSVFVATAFVAAACGLVRFSVMTDERVWRLLAALTVPILVCGAVSVIRGQFWAWFGYGVFAECVLFAWLMIWLLFACCSSSA